MPRHSIKWTPQEEQMVRSLRAQQIQKNYVSWEQIADNLNSKLRVNKSGKQCRQKYANYLKYDGNYLLNYSWSPQEIELFANLYLQRGPAWSYITNFLPNKSQNSLKNKFNNSLQVITKILNNYKIKYSTNHRGSKISELNTLSVLLRTSNQIVEYAQSEKLQINYNSLLFQFRTKLIQICFKPCLLTQQQKAKFIELTTKISTKLRVFKIFKAKNKKKLITCEKSLKAICFYDNVIKFQNYTTKQEISINCQKINSQNVEIKQQQQVNHTQKTIKTLKQIVNADIKIEEAPQHKIEEQNQPIYLQQAIFSNYGYYPFLWHQIYRASPYLSQ